MKFIASPELGRLAKWLRILGFDTVVENDKAHLVIRSLREDRVILTRDSKMSRFTGTRMVRIGSDFVEEQLGTLIKELGLEMDRSALFKICIICDEPLEEIDHSAAEGKVPGYVLETQEVFMRCPACGKIYWQGSHWELVNRFLDKI